MAITIVRRRPVLRAAAIGGGAYRVGKRRKGRRTATLPCPGLSDAAIERLERLGNLREQGCLTDQEFAEQKAILLRGQASDQAR